MFQPTAKFSTGQSSDSPNSAVIHVTYANMRELNPHISHFRQLNYIDIFIILYYTTVY